MKLIRPWSVQTGPMPTFIRGDGVFLFDENQRPYFDLCSQMMAVNLGHGNTRMTEAIRRQSDTVAFVSPAYNTPERDRLVSKLSEISPLELNRVLLTTGGAEAIENAIKIARLATGRHKIITKYRSYHGATAAAITASGDPRRLSQATVEAPGIVRIEDPYCYRCPWGQQYGQCGYECVSHLERIIEFEGPSTIAAILLEGESGTSGGIKYPPDYWPRAREIATKYGIVLIADEVMSGFRCGDWFAVNRHGVVPDMIVMAKGLTSGYVPMGGVLVRENLISPQFDNKPLSVGLTYAAHPIGCAAAATAIEIYQEKRLILKSLDLEFWLRSALHQRLRHIACVGDIRTTGFLATIELVIPGTHQPLVAWNSSDMTWPQRISSGLWAAGIIPMVRWNYLFVAPPLIATQAQLLDVIDQLGNILDVVSSEMNGLISENS